MDGKPFLRVDKEDEEMINFKPSSGDLSGILKISLNY